MPNELFGPKLGDWLVAVAVLGIGLVVLVGTDRWFSLLEDETTIVSLARQPVTETVGAFWNGPGQHRHPPLSDILLHFWLPAGGREWGPEQWAVVWLPSDEVCPNLSRFLNGHDQTFSKHIERFFDPRQLGGMLGIEHPPHFFFVAAQSSRQLHIGNGRLSHC